MHLYLFLLFALTGLISCSTNSFAHEIQILEPLLGAQEYEFSIYPDGVEKILKSSGPFLESNDLPLGVFKFRLRIKKNNKWSPWSNFSELSVVKQSRPIEIETESVPDPQVAPLRFEPFLFAMSRSIEAKNKYVKKSFSETAYRIGANLDSQYYNSHAFYESGKDFSRTDFGLMKTLSPYFQLGGKVIFASVKFKTAKGNARINSIHGFLHATGRYETQNRLAFRSSGGVTVQGSLLVNFLVSKSWMIQDKYKISPTIGYEELSLRNSGTHLNSSSFLAGVFAEFAL
jgi:hypothetical protein